MATFSGWFEGILLSLLFLLAFAAVIGGYNSYYGNVVTDSTLGLNVSGVQSAMTEYQNTLESATQGEAQYDSNGLSLLTSWKLIKGTGSLIWSVLTGGWLEALTNTAQLPPYFSLIFRILWFVSIGFIILTILFKIKP